MLARETPNVDQAAASAPMLDPKLCSLLDHIAVELAEEYVRLMEAAADAELGAPGPSVDSIGGDLR